MSQLSKTAEAVQQDIEGEPILEPSLLNAQVNYFTPAVSINEIILCTYMHTNYQTHSVTAGESRSFQPIH